MNIETWGNDSQKAAGQDWTARTENVTVQSETALGLTLDPGRNENELKWNDEDAVPWR